MILWEVFDATALIAAALVVLGVGLLSKAPFGPALTAAATLGFAVFVWVGLWLAVGAYLGPCLGPRLEEWALSAVESDWAGQALTNGLIAAAAWAPAALMTLAAAQFGLTGRAAGLRYRVAVSLIWLAGMILPGLGQGDAWPWASIALAVWAAALAAALAVCAHAAARAPAATPLPSNA